MAGPRARAKLARAIGPAFAKGPARGWALERVEAARPERLKMVLSKGSAKVVFSIRASGSAEGAFSKNLSLCCEGYEGRNVPAPIARLLESVGRRLDSYDLDGLLGVVEQDPETTPIENPADGMDAHHPDIAGPLGAHKDETGWRNFFCSVRIAPEANELIFDERMWQVEFGDAECFYSQQRIDPRLYNFINYPIQTSWARERAGAMAEIDDRGVILGAQKHVDALVEAVAQKPQKADVLLVNHLCTPLLIGADLDCLARRCEQATGLQAIQIPQVPSESKKHLAPFSLIFQRARQDESFLKTPEDPSSVNLFDFSETFLEEELLPLLSAIGLKPNACLLPRVQFPPLQRLMAGCAQVVWRHSYWEAELRSLMSGLPRPIVAVPAPYGVAGTKACGLALAEAKGKRDAFESAWKTQWKPAEEAWSRLTEQARQYRLAFIADRLTLGEMSGAQLWGGIPMRALLKEMGFAVDVLLFVPEGASKGDIPGIPARSAFSTPAELARRLKEGAFDAAYSDIYFDWRLTQAGKAQFSRQQFEMGAQGAIRSLRRLLSLCRLPFYRRYSASLTRRDESPPS